MCKWHMGVSHICVKPNRVAACYKLFYMDKENTLLFWHLVCATLAT